MNRDEALKMALEALETPSLSRGDPRLKAIQACKEALEQPAQEPVAWMHYKNFDLIYHDVWEELLEGKDEWYPLDYYVNSQLHRVVINHVEDLRKCIPALKKYPQMESTVIEVKKAINELEEALYTHPAPSWQGLSDDEIEKIDDETILATEFARAIEAKLKEKNT